MTFVVGHKIRNTGRTHFKKGVDMGFGFKKGHTPWHKGNSIQLNTGRTWFKKGHTITKELRDKIGVGLKLAYKNKQRKPIRMLEEDNWNWKGDGVGYGALHSWVRRRLGKPKKCEMCGKTKTTPKSIHWANKDHKYKRNLNDWISLCVSCHKKYDNILQRENQQILCQT